MRAMRPKALDIHEKKQAAAKRQLPALLYTENPAIVAGLYKGFADSRK